LLSIKEYEEPEFNYINMLNEEFGTTWDFRKAGYILSDGNYLDLSEGQQSIDW